MLNRLRHEGRRRSFGPGKLAEMSGDNRKLLEVLIQLSEAYGDYATALELRAQLHKPPITQVITESVYTPPEPAKAKRRTRRKPTTSKLSPLQASQQAWEELKLRREQ